MLNILVRYIVLIKNNMCFICTWTSFGVEETCSVYAETSTQVDRIHPAYLTSITSAERQPSVGLATISQINNHT